MKIQAKLGGLMAVAALALSVPVKAEVREWKARDGGKAISAEYVKSGDGSVTFRRKSDSKVFTVPLETLSDEDNAWVKEKESMLEEEALKASKDHPFAALITGKWERHEGHDLKYRFYAGKKLARAGDEGYPLLVYLHGRGGDVMTPEEAPDARAFSEDDNYRKRPCFIIAPQCPEGESWDTKNGESVIKIIEDLVKHLSVDKNRIYLTGFSMGGYGTFNLLANEPKWFAAGVPVAGGGNPDTASEFKKVPVWVFHGDQDDAVNVDQSRKLVEALEKARGIVKYTEYEGAGHGIIGRVYSDQELHDWLFAQRKK